MKVKIETPPDETGAIEGGEITGYIRHDLVEYGSDFGLAGRTGEQVKVYGVIRREQRDGRGASGLEFDRYMDVRAVEFVNDDSNIETENHEETFTELANTDDPVSLWKASIAPELYATPEWDRAFELGVAYLFAAPRINIPEGPTYRGDIHMLIVSDYGMGKSTFTGGIEKYSPKCIKKSATGLASDVGLTASAVRDDDFGEGSWTLKPGILVRGNGGHVILDEIDKGPDDLAKMNDALEGEQTVTVDKAGKDASFNSKVGLLATGNPVDGKFEPNTAVAPQIGVDSSLLSRFDGIVTMRDRPDEEIDGNVSQRIGEAYREAQEVAFSDREDMDVLDRPVPVEVGKAWVKYARENVQPQITQSQISDVRDWYASEIRQINENMSDEGATVDPPVPVTPRVVEDTIRLAVAFARVELRDTVADHNLQRAKDLRQTLAGQTFDGDKFVNRDARESGSQSQLSRRDRLVKTLRENDGLERQQLKDRMNAEEHTIENDIEKLKSKGEIYEPETDYLEVA
jgi:replicative DNA helicase Mcm